MIGTTVGSYRVTEKLSTGGMGTVYKAEHVLIGKLAAVKVLHPELRANPDVVNRFFNEAKATTHIKHPGIVEVFDFGYLPSGDGYIVMEFLEGVSLGRRLATRGTLDEGEAAIVLRAVCSALAAAHAKQIIHRDLKPDNIFLVPDPDSALGERPKLLDFGIAKLSDANLVGSGSVTKTGSVMGTPTYMSPEQCRGTGEIDHRSDLYSLGCIFYELVCGRPPFTSAGAGEQIGAHLFLAPEPPSRHRPSISNESEQLIMTLLEKSPDQRVQNARDLGQQLAAIAQRHGWSASTNPNAQSVEAARASRPSPTELEAPPFPVGSPSPLENAPTTPSDPSVSAPSAPLPKPTTLSGAASLSVIDVGRSRRRVGLIAGACAAVTVIAGAVVAIMMGHGSGTRHPAPMSPAAPHAATAPDREPAPLPAPAPAAVPAPAPPVAAPAPAAVPAAPVPDPVPVPEPAAAPPVHTPAAPSATPAAPLRPAPAKAAKRRPAPPPAAAAGSGSGKILIETDL